MHYGQCPKKAESRNQTIIQTYKDKYGANSIPTQAQYWTMCGRCSYSENQLEIGCEPYQILQSGLIEPTQFHGVEIDKDIYSWNSKVNNGMNWHYGDFYTTMIEYSNENTFNPAIVNADLIHMPKHAAPYISKIMMFLSTVGIEKTMLICNIVAEHRYLRSDIKEMCRLLESNTNYQMANNVAKWEIHSDYYWYNGTQKVESTGRSTKMMTMIFFKGEL